MSDAIWAAGAAVLVAVISVIGSIISSSKNAKATEATAEAAARKVSELTIYRIDQLEKKVDKHNSVIERTFRVEARCDVIEQRLDDAEKGE